MKKHPEQRIVAIQPAGEPLNGEIPSIPLSPKQSVLDYLKNGDFGGSGYKEGNIYIVRESKLRAVLLRAGFTEIALSRSFFGYSTDIVRSESWPQPLSERLHLMIRLRNRYELQPGKKYDAVEAISDIVQQYDPDLSEGEDTLRDEVLRQIDELEIIKQKLRGSGTKNISLSQWHFSLQGEVKFWLNPIQQDVYQSGWYTVAELQAWADGDPSSRVFKRKKPVNTKKPERLPVFKTEYEAALIACLQANNERLLRICLMGCPFPDLVERFSN